MDRATLHRGRGFPPSAASGSRCAPRTATSSPVLFQWVQNRIVGMNQRSGFVAAPMAHGVHSSPAPNRYAWCSGRGVRIDAIHAHGPQLFQRGLVRFRQCRGTTGRCRPTTRCRRCARWRCRGGLLDAGWPNRRPGEPYKLGCSFTVRNRANRTDHPGETTETRSLSSALVICLRASCACGAPSSCRANC